MPKEKEYEFKFENNKIELFDLILSGLFESEEVQYGRDRETGLLALITRDGTDDCNLIFEYDDLTLTTQYFLNQKLKTGSSALLYYYCQLGRTDYVVQFEVLEFNREILKIRKK